MSSPTAYQFNSAHNGREHFWKLIFQNACCFTLAGNFFPVSILKLHLHLALYSVNSQSCRSFKQTAFSALFLNPQLIFIPSCSEYLH